MTQHDVAAVREGSAYALPGFAPHQDAMAGGEFLETFQVVRQMPGKLVFAADDVMPVQRRNQGNARAAAHSDTPALTKR